MLVLQISSTQGGGNNREIVPLIGIKADEVIIITVLIQC